MALAKDVNDNDEHKGDLKRPELRIQKKGFCLACAADMVVTLHGFGGYG
jgi:hypothetical protein